MYPYGWIPIDPTPGWSIPSLSAGSSGKATKPQEQLSLPKNPKVPTPTKPQVHLKGPGNTGKGGRAPKHAIHISATWHVIWGAIILLVLLLVALVARKYRRRSRSLQTWGSMQRWLWIHQRISLHRIETPRQFAAIWASHYDTAPKLLFEMVRLAERALYGQKELSVSEVSTWQNLWKTVKRSRRSKHRMSA